jgi:phytanoyl-CoA hydroxylase
MRLSFERDGFVALRSFVAGDTLSELNANVERFIRDVVPRLSPAQAFHEQDGALKQIQRMGDHDDWFGELFTRGRFRALAELLLQGPVVPKNLQFFDKPPDSNRATPAHQDGHYFMLTPCRAVTLWLALTAVDEQTGCLRYVRGSHRRGMREHARTQVLGFSQGITDYPTVLDRRSEEAQPARCGDLLAHDALMIHRADANRSTSRSRRALGFIYYGAEAREDSIAHKAYQDQLARGFEAPERG